MPPAPFQPTLPHRPQPCKDPDRLPIHPHTAHPTPQPVQLPAHLSDPPRHAARHPHNSVTSHPPSRFGIQSVWPINVSHRARCNPKASQMHRIQQNNPTMPMRHDRREDLPNAAPVLKAREQVANHSCHIGSATLHTMLLATTQARSGADKCVSDDSEL